MKKIIVLLLVLLFIAGNLPVEARRGRLTPAQKRKIHRRVKAMSVAQRKASAKALNVKLTRLRRQIKLASLKANRRALLNAEIERIESEIALIKSMQVVAAPPPPPPPPRRRPVPVKPVRQPKPARAKMRLTQIGISGGYIAGIPGAIVDIRFHNPFAMLRTSTRIGAAYAQGEDTAGTTRKHALLVLDGIYRLNPPHTQGLRSYVGVGLNYDAYTTGQTSGGLGYQAYYGIEGGRFGGGQTFFEVGYGKIRTGFSPEYTGATAQAGYRF